MKRAIHNPNTVNHLLYVRLIVLFGITLLLSHVLPKSLSGERTFFSEVLLNLSYGCIASTVVAWLIDCANIRIANKRANSNYDAVYLNLKVSIGWFLDSWARVCDVCFDDEDYANTYHTWHEWYSLAKDRYQNAEEERQIKLMTSYRDELSRATQKVITDLEIIRAQSTLLTLNQIMDSCIDSILLDYQFEFKALSRCLSLEKDDAMFWDHMDAITQDLINYINNWSDIRHYNTQAFKPFNFFEKVLMHNSTN